MKQQARLGVLSDDVSGRWLFGVRGSAVPGGGGLDEAGRGIPLFEVSHCEGGLALPGAQSFLLEMPDTAFQGVKLPALVKRWNPSGQDGLQSLPQLALEPLGEDAGVGLLGPGQKQGAVFGEVEELRRKPEPALPDRRIAKKQRQTKRFSGSFGVLRRRRGRPWGDRALRRPGSPSQRPPELVPVGR